MSTDDRRALILQILRAQGSVSVADLAAQSGVSASTIRRDLAEMETMGLLRRTHGGAQWLPETGPTPAIAPERALGYERIGQRAARLVRPGQSLVLDSGPVAERVAAYLKTSEGPLTVFTNSIPVALELAPSGHIVTLLTGGQVMHPSLTLGGYPAERTLDDIAVDWALLCPDGIDLRRGLFTNDLSSVMLRQRMVRVAQRTVAIIEARLIGRPALTNFASLSETHIIVTTSDLAAEARAELQARGIELILA